MTVQINRSLNEKLKKLEGMCGEAFEEKVVKLANDAVNITLTSTSSKGKVGAIDTGAYITSFSITSGGAGRPRGKSSHGKTRNRSDAVALGEVARSDLYSDIAKIDFSEVDSVAIRNHSPHAELVENGKGANYRIFAQIRDKLRDKHG